MSTVLSLPALRRARSISITAPRPELAGLLALAALLYLWALDRNGFANDYYAAAVRSMSSSWHAFLYGSFDPAGVMTVDKPPLALWVQALSARVFGYGSWSLLAPQALMGVASVGLLCDLTRRRFGRPAGFVAGLVLALTPMTVAIARHNNPDALLGLCCVAALWFVVRGLEDGRARWIVLAGVCVGLGFEAKMAAALLVVPGIAAAWLWVAPRGRAVAARQLAAAGAAMAAVGLAWPMLVWLTPAADRPWVSGTSDNSIWSLIFGYNGLGRLFGQSGGPGGAAGGPGGAGGFFGGEPGVLRLLNAALGGQAGWLLGFALAGGVGLVVVTRLRRSDPRAGWLLAAGGTALTTAVAFSGAEGIFHPYYVSQLAPFTAALVGATTGVILRGGRAARVLGPAAVLAGVVTEWAVLGDAADLRWLVPIVGVAGVAAAAVLALDPFGVRGRSLAVAAAIAALLVGPATWSVQTLGHATSGTFPAGGPTTTAFAGGARGSRFGGPPPGAGVTVPPAARSGGPAGAGPLAGSTGGPTAGSSAGPTAGSTGGTTAGSSAGATAGSSPAAGGPFGGDTGALSEALAYARSHGGGTIAVSSQTGAAGALIASGADVAGIGGFSGRESQVSTAWLAGAVASGQIRWALVSGQGGPDDGRTGSSDVMAAVQQAGTPVSSVSGLYDLQGAAAALRTL